MRQGYELNYPLIPVEVEPHAGIWPSSHSFISVQPANVIVTALKKAEDTDALIIRFYEFEGKSAMVQLELPKAASSAQETDLMEKTLHPLDLQKSGREVEVPVSPYSITTIAASFRAVDK